MSAWSARGIRERAIALCVAIAVCSASKADAQVIRLTLAGFPLNVTSTTGADFEAGFVNLGSTSFTVDRISGLILLQRITTVSVLCQAACPQAGTLTVNGLQWRRSDLATWNTLTTTAVTVEARTLTLLGANDPWGNSMQWRYLLNWTTNPATAMTRWQVVFRLTTSAP